MSRRRHHPAILANLESMERSLPTSAPAMARLRTSLSIEDPLDLVRKIVQKELNQKIHSLFQEYIRYYFQPAAKNVEANLGLDTSDLLEQTCINALEHAKVLFRGKGQALKRPSSPSPPSHEAAPPIKKKHVVLPKTKMMFSLNGKIPQWNVERLNQDTMFILGSKANKALGYTSTIGKIYSRHPEVFRYPADPEDKAWLAKELIMSTTGGKAFIMVLEDVLELSNSPGYTPHIRRRTSELTGFKIPDFMIEKIKKFMKRIMTDIKDDPLPPLLHQVNNSGEVWNHIKTETKVEDNNIVVDRRGGNEVDLVASTDVHDILNGIKDEGGTGNPTGESVEDDLGFLHGMNLTSLVREFEMEAGAGSQHLGILSLADDTESFSELSNEVQENMESFDNIEFN